MKEAIQFKDLHFLDCEEGSSRGRRTQMVVVAFEAYLNHYASYDYFMKVDDDTFVAWSKLWNQIARISQGGACAAYAGSMASKESQRLPVRSSLASDYELRSVYANATYPVSAFSGSGYILKGDIVRSIMTKNVATGNMLWNGASTVSVWVAELVRARHLRVCYYDLEAVDGSSETPFQVKQRKTKTYRYYPYLLYHRAGIETLICLACLDAGYF